MADAEEEKQRAIAENDHALFRQAVTQIERLHKDRERGLPNIYTCPQCGEDFEHGKHVDLLVAAILDYADDGSVAQFADYGLLTVQENGRRFKFCDPCISSWKIHPLTYAEMR